VSLARARNANDKSPATGETAGQRQGRNHHETLSDYREAGREFCGRRSTKPARITQRLFAEMGAVLTRPSPKPSKTVRPNRPGLRSGKNGVQQGRVPPCLHAQRFRAAGRRMTRRTAAIKPSELHRFAAALYLRPLASSGRLIGTNLARSAAMPSYRPSMKSVSSNVLPKRHKPRKVTPVAPIRPRRGGVMVSVEALYKMAQIAFDLGKMDEADALFAAAKNAADADERALIRPYGTGGPAS
jgi:hypothetical protein